MRDSQTNTRRVAIRVIGRVQGVSYRASACERAHALGLRGHIRNLDTGEVDAVAEGLVEDVEAFIAWCQQGPSAATVQSVEVRDLPAAGPPLASFQVEWSSA